MKSDGKRININLETSHTHLDVKRGAVMAVYVCGKCGYETGDVRCRPKSCPKCGAPRDEFKKK